MLEGGEDPRFLARRITRMSVEDIGLADPQAQTICLHAWETYERLGSPEGELALAQAVTYLALAPNRTRAMSPTRPRAIRPATPAPSRRPSTSSTRRPS